MKFAPRFRAENVNVHTESLEVVVDMFDVAIPDKGIIVRNLFSLTGTRAEDTSLRLLPKPLEIVLHPGYSSVGRVELVGKNSHRFNTHDLILLPIHYATWIVVDTLKTQNQGSFFLSKLSGDVDPVQATFVPLISFARSLLLHLNDTSGTVLLLGYGLFTEVLIRLLHADYKDIEPIVILDESDNFYTIMYTNLTCTFVTAEDIHNRIPNCDIRCAFILSESIWNKAAVKEFLSQHNISCITALPRTGETYYPWLRSDALLEASRSLDNERLHVQDFIAQHIHIEEIKHVTMAIQQGHYDGRAIIYDW